MNALRAEIKCGGKMSMGKQWGHGYSGKALFKNYATSSCL